MLDVLYAAPLGQHALGLVVVVYLVVRLRSFFIIFPLWQATVALVPAWVLYCFLMYWIDGATQHEAEVWLRWLPAISTTLRSEEHTSELQSLMRISYAVFCLKNKKVKA